MERESFKEYSEAVVVKKELCAMKSCFKELYMFLSMGSVISAEPNKQSVKEISSSRGTLQ